MAPLIRAGTTIIHESPSGAKCLEFLKIFCEVENGLDRFAGVVGLVVAVHVGLRRSTLRTPSRDMIAAAGHDSVLIAKLCPSAMLFVPSVGGITHNPREYSTKEQVARGAQVLLDAVVELAG